MNANQYGGLLTVLTEIRDRLPGPDPAPDWMATPTEIGSVRVTNVNGKAYFDPGDVLGKVLQVLDGWIEGAQEDHEASEHRDENRGEECWRSFAPSDIRNMINDAARELGMTEFPAPVEPREDQGL